MITISSSDVDTPPRRRGAPVSARLGQAAGAPPLVPRQPPTRRPLMQLLPPMSPKPVPHYVMGHSHYQAADTYNYSNSYSSTGRRPFFEAGGSAVNVVGDLKQEPLQTYTFDDLKGEDLVIGTNDKSESIGEVPPFVGSSNVGPFHYGPFAP